MNKEDFEKLEEHDKEVVFDEMLELITLVEYNPVSIEELKVFTEWHNYIGKYGEDLHNLLIGIYPFPELGKNLNKEQLNTLLKHSEEAIRLATFWNKSIRKRIEMSK